MPEPSGSAWLVSDGRESVVGYRLLAADAASTCWEPVIAGYPFSFYPPIERSVGAFGLSGRAPMGGGPIPDQSPRLHPSAPRARPSDGAGPPGVGSRFPYSHSRREDRSHGGTVGVGLGDVLDDDDLRRPLNGKFQPRQ